MKRLLPPMALLLLAGCRLPSSLQIGFSLPSPPPAPAEAPADSGFRAAPPGAPASGKPAPAAPTEPPIQPPSASPAGEASPTATPTPTPPPASEGEMGILVTGASHRIPIGGETLLLGGETRPVLSVTGTAYNNAAKGYRFPAMLAAQPDADGWRYERVTPETAAGLRGFDGNTMPVFFLDSSDGLGDNSGAWTFTVGTPEGGTTTLVADPKVHVTAWDPTRTAMLDVGASGTFKVEATYDETNGVSEEGVCLVYSHPDGVRDFGVLRHGQGPVTIDARGYVYAFFLGQGGESDQDAMLHFTRQ